MTIGPAAGLALAASALAVLVWFLVSKPRPAFDAALATFLLVFVLALVILAGPLIQLP